MSEAIERTRVPREPLGFETGIKPIIDEISAPVTQAEANAAEYISFYDHAHLQRAVTLAVYGRAFYALVLAALPFWWKKQFKETHAGKAENMGYQILVNLNENYKTYTVMLFPWNDESTKDGLEAAWGKFLAEPDIKKYSRDSLIRKGAMPWNELNPDERRKTVERAKKEALKALYGIPVRSERNLPRPPEFPGV